MIKVLQIGFTSNYGGVEACIMNYYRALDRTQIQFGFTDIWEKDIAYKDEIISLGGTVHKVTSWSQRPLSGTRALKKLINENSYDIIHFNMNSLANIFQFLAADKSKAKAWLIHVHTAGSETSRLKRLLQSFNSHVLEKKASCLCACSKKAAEYMFRDLKDQSKVQIINNAISLKNLRFDREKRNELRARYHLEDCYVIGHIGRFTFLKNQARLVDIFQIIHSGNKKARMILVGDGELRNEVEQKIKELKLENCILTTGMLPNAYELYNAFDVFVLPSMFEGLPVVGIEAQAAGLPVLVSDSITSEMKLTDNTIYIPLSESNERWAKEILQFEGRTEQERESVQMKDTNMDISKEVIKLQDLYRSLLV